MMKRVLMMVAAVAVACTGLAATPASAQRPGPDHDRGGPPPWHEPGPPVPRHERDDHRPPGPPHRLPPDHDRHAWRAGERLPPAYRADRYVIVSPPRYHLHRPPPHHHWVRVDGDAFLVVAGTGVIVEIVHGLFR